MKKLNVFHQLMRNIFLFLKKIIVDTITKNNKEINVSFEIRFIDSFKFLQSSFDLLVKTLPPEKFESSNKHTFKKIFVNGVNLLIRKGIHSYDYTDSLKILLEKLLLLKEEFYSILNNSHISDDDFKHAKKVLECIEKN